MSDPDYGIIKGILHKVETILRNIKKEFDGKDEDEINYDELDEKKKALTEVCENFAQRYLDAGGAESEIPLEIQNKLMEIGKETDYCPKDDRFYNLVEYMRSQFQG
jgi:hypothetical protein